MDYIYPLCVQGTAYTKCNSVTVFLNVWVSVTARVGAVRGFALVLQL